MKNQTLQAFLNVAKSIDFLPFGTDCTHAEKITTQIADKITEKSRKIQEKNLA
jgi:hypothetical protein